VISGSFCPANIKKDYKKMFRGLVNLVHKMHLTDESLQTNVGVQDC
jgi:hypothetical protein